MATIGSSARVTPGRDSSDDTKEKAWRVWKRAVKAAQARASAPMSDSTGRAGLKFKGSMSEVIRQEFPASRAYGAEDWTAFSRSITSHLTASHNAECLSRPPSSVIWWLSVEWQDSAQPDRQPTKAEHAERRVTPHEAGEDRPAAPVIIRAVKAHDEAEAPPVSGDAFDQQVIDAIKGWPEPSVSLEVQAKLGLEATRTFVTLNRLVKAGRLFARTETGDERTARAHGVPSSSRRARLFWHERPVPPRTLVEFMPNTAPTHGSTGLEMAAVKMQERHRLAEERMDELMLDMLLNKHGGQFASWATVANDLTADNAPFVGEGSVRASFLRLEAAGLVKIHAVKGRPALVTAADYVGPTAPVTPIRSKQAAVNRRGEPVIPVTESPVDRVVLEKLAAATNPVTTEDLAGLTGYSTSRIGDTMRNFPDHVQHVGTRNRHKIYAWIGKHVASPDPATPTPAPEVPVSVAAVTDAPARSGTDPAELVRQLAASLGVTFEDPSQVAALEARVAELEDRLVKAQRKITALSEV